MRSIVPKSATEVVVEEKVNMYQVDEAIVSKIVSKLKDSATKSIDSLMSKFDIGCIVNDMLKKNKSYGDNLISQISVKVTEKIGYVFHKNKLYEMARVARVFNEDREKFKSTLNKLMPYDISWSFIATECTGFKPECITEGDKKAYCEDLQKQSEKLSAKSEAIASKVDSVQKSSDFSEEHKKNLSDAIKSINSANGNKIPLSIAIHKSIKEINKITNILTTILEEYRKNPQFITEEKEQNQTMYESLYKLQQIFTQFLELFNDNIGQSPASKSN